MPASEQVTELQGIRHDLKNILSAFRSGCMLIENLVGEEERPQVQEIVDELRKSIEDGAALVDRLNETQAP